MKNIFLSALFLSLTFNLFGNAMEHEAPRSEPSSRAWYVLRQLNVGPLLLGLPQRLGKAIESSQRDDSIWTGIEQGGSLKLNITVEGDVTGEILIGFFKDPSWSSEPVQVRSFPGPGDYLVENLPAGNFQIGAMIGSLPVTDALGVQQTWPEPVEVKRDKNHSAKILVSRDFQRRSSGWYNKTVSRDFIGDWNYMDTDNPLQGCVSGPGGEPVAFATVQIREYKPGARSIRAPNRGTNEQGHYKCDGINWPYRVGVIRYKLMPSVLGCCHQYLSYNRVFQECETVNFQFDNYPVGNATVKGQVLDQKGNPLKEFIIDLTTKMDWEVRKNPDGKFYPMTGYRVPFISEDGSFKMDNLPVGDLTVRVIPFDIRSYEIHRGEDIRLEADKAKTVNLEVTAKGILYGRVLFRDGSPAVVKPTPWPGAKTSILFPMGSRDRGVAEVDDEGYFAVNLSEREVEMLKSGRSRLIINVPTSEERRRKTMGDFPFEKLAKDTSTAGIVKIARPERTPKPLVGNPLPTFDGIEIEFDAEQANDKTILVCFFDMNQRPSRNCLLQLSERAQELKAKDVVVVAVQSSMIDENTLDKWIKDQNIPFAIGMVRVDEEEIRFRWGIKSLPWLILTNKQHTVIAEGFGLDELDEEITSR
jgi:hypothetical protein